MVLMSLRYYLLVAVAAVCGAAFGYNVARHAWAWAFMVPVLAVTALLYVGWRRRWEWVSRSPRTRT
jgi:uncharacterized membrane protein